MISFVKKTNAQDDILRLHAGDIVKENMVGMPDDTFKEYAGYRRAAQYCDKTPPSLSCDCDNLNYGLAGVFTGIVIMVFLGHH